MTGVVRITEKTKDAFQPYLEGLRYEPGSILLGYLTDDLPIGVLAAEQQGTRIIIKRLFVNPAYRGIGVANKLLEQIVDVVDRMEGFDIVCYSIFDPETDEMAESAAFTAGFEREGILDIFSFTLEGVRKQLPKPHRIDRHIKMVHDLSDEEVMRFIIETRSDDERDMYLPDFDNICDDSVCYVDNGEILGIIVFEKSNDVIKIPYSYAQDTDILRALITAAADCFYATYKTDLKFLFVADNSNQMKILSKIAGDSLSISQKMVMYTYDPYE